MIDNIFYFVGVFVVLLLIIYACFGVLYIIIKPKVNLTDSEMRMPVLKPISIPAENQRYIDKISFFIFEVRKWEVIEHWKYTYVSSEENIELIVPKGFIFDGASVPRLFWAFLNPTGLLLIQGLLHDYAYKYEQLWQEVDGQAVPYMKGARRNFWDALFGNIGNEVHGFVLINKIASIAVSLGGNGAWKKHRYNGLIADPFDLND